MFLFLFSTILCVGTGPLPFWLKPLQVVKRVCVDATALLLFLADVNRSIRGIECSFAFSRRRARPTRSSQYAAAILMTMPHKGRAVRRPSLDMASASGESCILAVLRIQRPAFDKSLQDRVSRPLWVLPNWPEAASSLGPVSRTVHAEILRLTGKWTAANLEAEEERICEYDRIYRAGILNPKPWGPDSREALILLRTPVIDYLRSGWPIAMDAAGVGHVAPFCPDCRTPSWTSYWSFRYKWSDFFHMCFWCRKDMRSAEDPKVVEERKRRSIDKQYRACCEKIRRREELGLMRRKPDPDGNLSGRAV
jgi:hypothetical protein